MGALWSSWTSRVSPFRSTNFLYAISGMGDCACASAGSTIDAAQSNKRIERYMHMLRVWGQARVARIPQEAPEFGAPSLAPARPHARRARWRVPACSSKTSQINPSGCSHREQDLPVLRQRPAVVGHGELDLVAHLAHGEHRVRASAGEEF